METETERVERERRETGERKTEVVGSEVQDGAMCLSGQQIPQKQLSDLSQSHKGADSQLCGSVWVQAHLARSPRGWQGPERAGGKVREM